MENSFNIEKTNITIALISGNNETLVSILKEEDPLHNTNLDTTKDLFSIMVTDNYIFFRRLDNMIAMRFFKQLSLLR